jgi:hypothetical protein
VAATPLYADEHGFPHSSFPISVFPRQLSEFQLLPSNLPGAETIVPHSCPHFTTALGQPLSKHFIFHCPDR